MNTGNNHYVIGQEELLSEIEIQDRVIKSFEKAVYENIGQILSLAKMQLFTINTEKRNDLQLRVNNSRKLIGKAIHDLRHIIKQLSPRDIMQKGFAFAIQYELERIKYSTDCETAFNLNGLFFKLDDKRELLLFSIVQEFVGDILNMQVSKLSIEITYAVEFIGIVIVHHHKEIGLIRQEAINQNSRLIERLKLIEGELTTSDFADKGLIAIMIKK